MAELALAIVGAVAAWKSIIEFGDLISKVTDDDARRREGLWLQLQVSQYRLKDWGHDWGLDQPDGRFHRFEPGRKELIVQIIFRLRDSRHKALDRLGNRYGLAAKADEPDPAGAATDPLSRLIGTMKTASKRAKHKTVWLAHDQETVSDLVRETVELHEHLQYLTYGSAAFIRESLPSVKSAPSLEDGLRQLDRGGRQSAQDWQRSLTGPPNSPSGGGDVDEQTLASYAVKAIASSRQAGHVHGHIDRAFYFHGDLRIAEIISGWWDDDRSSLLLLETPDIADDHTAAFTCALVYYLTSCHRLVYSVPQESAVAPGQQYFHMLQTLILSMVDLHGDQAPPTTTPLPSRLGEMEGMPMNDSTLAQLADLFHEMLLSLVNRPAMRVLLIIYGLEVCEGEGEESNTHIPHQQSFFRNLQKICSQPPSGSGSTVKVLLGCKGHAMTLYDCLEPESIADVTSHPTDSTNLMQELALKLKLES